MRLDQLELHQDESPVALHAVHAGVHRIPRHRRHDRLGIRDQRGRWRGGHRSAAELPLHAVIPLRWPLQDGVTELATEEQDGPLAPVTQDRKSTRLNSSHGYNSYAVF